MRDRSSGRGPALRLLILVLCTITLGCGALGPAAKDVTKSTVRGAYEEFDGIDDALRERVVHKLMDSPAVHAAAHDLLTSAVTGTIDGLTEAERDGKINAFVDAAMGEMQKQGDAAMGEFFAHFQRELAPVLHALIRELVASTSAAFREAAVRDLPVITSAILDSTMRAFAVAASTATEQMRAQAKGFAEHDLGPIAGVISQQVAHDAVLGIREGLHQDLNLHDPEVRDGMREMGIGLAQGIAQGTPTSPFTTTFAISTFVLGALFLLALGALIAVWSRARTTANLVTILAQRLDSGAKSDSATRRAVTEANAET
jgi:hypothetical protein